MKNWIICLTRAFQYFFVEKVKLRWYRLRHDFYYSWPSYSPLVSVYIPTHNRVKLLLSRSLKSVLAQTYKNIEVIVIAHGCNDGTEEEVRKLDDHRVRVVSIKRTQTYPSTLENHWYAGRVAATNVGLSKCCGEWIATNDDDDEWTEDHLESLVRFALAGNYEFVSGASTNPLGPIKPYEINGNKIGGIGTWVYRSYLKSFKFNPDCWRKSWNKVCDTDIQDRFVKAGVRMGYLNKVVTKILPRPGDSAVGLIAAKNDPRKYLNHLSFR